MEEKPKGSWRGTFPGQVIWEGLGGPVPVDGHRMAVGQAGVEYNPSRRS